jgi:hypothetical protein
MKVDERFKLNAGTTVVGDGAGEAKHAPATALAQTGIAGASVIE